MISRPKYMRIRESDSGDASPEPAPEYPARAAAGSPPPDDADRWSARSCDRLLPPPSPAELPPPAPSRTDSDGTPRLRRRQRRRHLSDSDSDSRLVFAATTPGGDTPPGAVSGGFGDGEDEEEDDDGSEDNDPEGDEDRDAERRQEEEEETTTLCAFLPRMRGLSRGRLGLRSLVRELATISRMSCEGPARDGCASPSRAPVPPAPSSGAGGGAGSGGGCASKDSSRYTSGRAGRGDPGDEWRSNGNFISKPTRGWIHGDDQIMGSGVAYTVRYMGCVEVLKSMRSLDFNTRTLVTREAIGRVCEAVPGSNGSFRRRKGPSQTLGDVLGKSNLQFAGLDIILTISISSLNLMTPETKQIIANHHMQSISFASGGDQETTDYVAYVAKDPVNQRACHVLECLEGLAQDVICTIGQAFEQRFKQYLKSPARPAAVAATTNAAAAAIPHSRPEGGDGATEREEDEEEEEVSRATGRDHEYYNDLPSKEPPPGGLVDARTLEGAGGGGAGAGGAGWAGARPQRPPQSSMATRGENGTVAGKSVYDSSASYQRQSSSAADGSGGMRPGARVEATEDPSYVNTSDMDGGGLSSERLRGEPWFHGRVSRGDAEKLLGRDGDFLVRESGSTPGQYVLTGMQGGRPKHLLLVDPEGVVRTKDRKFDSVNHLISFHRDNQLPIISAGSELCLKQPVHRKL
uniref:SHC-transforming protein 1 n=1 Tax=Petromyzon marinus TaxID=7757 RepID=A0AAJ7XE21_PETMA|nr:SHC-transforming protein 1 [Petromyzon marinus]XP_032829838.1 SHC-transforming protein 1 [Petromyzon marinus]